MSWGERDQIKELKEEIKRLKDAHKWLIMFLGTYRSLGLLDHIPAYVRWPNGAPT